jgi:ketosteroid isomerase-like protein
MLLATLRNPGAGRQATNNLTPQEETMKTLLLRALVGLAIGFPAAALAQEKEEATPFLYRAIPASPQIAQQLEATNAQFDEAINKHDAVAVAALFTANATLVGPEGIFSGRDSIAKHYTDWFQRWNPSDQITKLSYVYAFGDDLCGIGGLTVTVNGPIHGGRYLIHVYTRVRDTWKIRVAVDKYRPGP